MKFLSNIQNIFAILQRYKSYRTNTSRDFFVRINIESQPTCTSHPQNHESLQKHISLSCCCAQPTPQCICIRHLPKVATLLPSPSPFSPPTLPLSAPNPSTTHMAQHAQLPSPPRPPLVHQLCGMGFRHMCQDRA